MTRDPSRVDEFVEALLSLDRRAARGLLKQATAEDETVRVLEGLVTPAMERIGDMWERGDVALTQVYVSGRMCQKLIQAMMPESGTLREGQPRLAIGVLSDAHSLGKQLVLFSLGSAGYRARDLGAQCTTEDMVNACVDDRIDILIVSVLMLRAALAVADLKQALAVAAPETKLVVGGAPFRFDAQLWREVGADRYGHNASDITRILADLEVAS